MIPFLCGGTLVFDERGNILYWCKKGGTQTGEFVEEGERRREALLDYVAKLIRVGVIGLSEGEATYGVDLYQPAILGRRVNGALHLEMTSEFLNRGTEMRWME
jgi:hypothetical protein